MRTMNGTYPVSTYRHAQRSRMLPRVAPPLSLDDKRNQVYREMRSAGATWWGMLKSETQHLPRVLHDGEHIEAIAYGRYINGSAMLVATDRRVIFLDTKPFFLSSDEITYDIVSGVSYGQSWLLTSLTLHTRIGDYPLKDVSRRSAQRFVHYIEQRCLEHSGGSSLNMQTIS